MDNSLWTIHEVCCRISFYIDGDMDLVGVGARLAVLPSNAPVVRALFDAAELLRRQGAPPAMTEPYIGASSTIGRVADIGGRWLRFGLGGLLQDKRLAPGLALAASEILRTGNWSRSEWLQGNRDHPSEVARVPGIGPTLGVRLKTALGAVSLEQLYVLSRSGRLAGIEGFGKHRLPSVSRFVERVLGVGEADLISGPSLPRARLLLRLDAEFRARVRAHLTYTVAAIADGSAGGAIAIIHAIVGPWHCSLKTLECGRDSPVSITIDRGDLLFQQYLVRSDPESGARIIEGMGETEAELSASVSSH